MEKDKINLIVNSLAHSIESKAIDTFTDIGVMYGKSSLLLYYYYRYLENNEQNYADLIYETISDIVNEIENGVYSYTLSNGITGFGYVLNEINLRFKDEELKTLLEQVDEIVLKFLEECILDENFDYMHGGFGAVFYFLKREKIVLFETSIKSFIEKFEECLSSNESGKWLYIPYLPDEESKLNKNYINFGLAHGSCSYIVLFSELIKINFYSAELSSLCKQLYAFVMNTCYQYHQTGNYDNNSFMPLGIYKGEFLKSRQSWCNGDFCLLTATVAMHGLIDASTLNKTKQQIQTFLLNKNNPSNHLLVDSCLCHGYSGNALILSHHFKDKAWEEYWLSNLELNFEKYNRFLFYSDIKTAHKENYTLMDGEIGVYLALKTITNQIDFNWYNILLLF